MYKLSLAKKLFKESYKMGNMHIGQTAGREIYVTGRDWSMRFDQGCMPKEIKGELIALCGGLPDPGRAYRAIPDSGDQQMEILREEFASRLDDTDAKTYHPTRAYLIKGSLAGGVLRSPESAQLVIIDSRALSLIEPAEKENISGPFRRGDLICWKGKGSEFRIRIWDREDEGIEKFLAALESGWL